MEEKLFGVSGKEALDMITSLLADLEEGIELRENGEQSSIYFTMEEMKFLRGLLTMQRGMCIALGAKRWEV